MGEDHEQDTIIGLDLAKYVFHVVCCDARGKRQSHNKLQRKQLLSWFARQTPCLVGMETCATAHYWGRELRKLGYEVKLIPAQHVKAYLRGNKNDYNDAQAIAEAVVRPQMRFVAIKSTEEQDIQALHRLREPRVHEHTALSNQLRGLLGEYGISIPRGPSVLKRRLPELLEDAENGLSERFHQLLHLAWQQRQELEHYLREYDREIKRVVKENQACQRLQTIPGFGPVVASVFLSQTGNGEGFRLPGAGAPPTQQWRQGGTAGDQQTRRRLSAWLAGSRYPGGGAPGRWQAGSVESLDTASGRKTGSQQGGGRPGKQTGTLRLGDPGEQDHFSAGLSGRTGMKKAVDKACEMVDESCGSGRLSRGQPVENKNRYPPPAHRTPFSPTIPQTQQQIFY